MIEVKKAMERLAGLVSEGVVCPLVDTSVKTTTVLTDPSPLIAGEFSIVSLSVTNPYHAEDSVNDSVRSVSAK